MKTLAGHSMVPGPRGSVCQQCGRTWIEMLDNRDRWRPGEFGIAHTGGLTDGEVRELQAELDRIWACL